MCNFIVSAVGRNKVYILFHSETNQRLFTVFRSIDIIRIAAIVLFQESIAVGQTANGRRLPRYICTPVVGVYISAASK
jgi:hypothetical protein